MYSNDAGHCPLHVTKPRCIIIDNIECMSEHQDMAGLVRVGEWSGTTISFCCLSKHSKAKYYIGMDEMQGTRSMHILYWSATCAGSLTGLIEVYRTWLFSSSSSSGWMKRKRYALSH